jgi:lysophospholipase L1-like esterase
LTNDRSFFIFDDMLDSAPLPTSLEQAPWKRMVVVGDSVAAGVREPLDGYRDMGFADQVGEALGGAYLNLGVPGLRLAEIRESQLADALAFAPDIALVIAGGNDALDRDYSPARVRGDLTAIVGPLAGTGAFVVTVGLFDLARSGLLPPDVAPLMIARFDELDAITADVVAGVGGLHVDTHHHPRAADPAIYASDQIHANALGHAVAFSAVVDSLGSWLSR